MRLGTRKTDFSFSMYLCAVCSYSTIRKREWENHSRKRGHSLHTNENDDDDDDENMISVSSSFENDSNPSPNINYPPSDSPPEAPQEDLGNEQSPPDDQHEDSLEEEAWFPWKSKSHFYLTTLYHGSHRR